MKVSDSDKWHSLGTHELVVNKRLSACFNAGDPVTHGVEAGLGRVDLDDDLKLDFAAFELVLEIHAVGLALFENEGLGVFTSSDHVFDVLFAVNVRVKSRFVSDKSGHKVVEKVSSHF